MDILIWLLFGSLIGWIASIITRTDEDQGVLSNLLIGVLGAVSGGYFSKLIGFSELKGFNDASLIIALIGATILVTIVNVVRNRSLND